MWPKGSRPLGRTGRVRDTPLARVLPWRILEFLRR
jgi:hypothetical protein